MKNLFFDVGNVLIYFDLNKMFTKFADQNALAVDQLEDTFHQTDLLHEFERGLLDNETFYSEFSRVMGVEIDYSVFHDIVTDIFEPNLEIIPIIKKLKKQGYPLFLLSNTNDIHFSYCREKFPILSLFDQHVLSHEVGARKPDPEIYEYAVAKAKSTPADCFFVDDLVENIESARSFGMDAEVFVDNKTLIQQLQDRKIIT